MRADRLLSLMLILQDRGKVKAKELATQLGVSQRTIYRDMEALAAAGVPVYAEAGPSGGIALTANYRTRLTGISQEEAQALSTFHVPGSLDDIGLSQSLKTGLIKLAASLPAMHQIAAEHVRRRLHIDTSPWFRAREEVPHLTVLRQAVWEDRQVRLTYRNLGGACRTHEVDPYGLVVKLDRWYLVGAAQAQTPRRLVFRVSRVTEVLPLDRTFDRPEDFDLQSFWEDWHRQFQESRRGYPVTLRVSPQAEEVLHEMPGGWGAKLTAVAPREDGWKVITLDFERESFALSSVLWLGDRVEVLEPEALRQRCMEIACQIRQRYE